jgi:hypothetical protein
MEEEKFGTKGLMEGYPAVNHWFQTRLFGTRTNSGVGARMSGSMIYKKLSFFLVQNKGIFLG